MKLWQVDDSHGKLSNKSVPLYKHASKKNLHIKIITSDILLFFSSVYKYTYQNKVSCSHKNARSIGTENKVINPTKRQ